MSGTALDGDGEICWRWYILMFIGTYTTAYGCEEMDMMTMHTTTSNFT
jgi:hypothetical protein